jgi:hypothetical protein
MVTKRLVLISSAVVSLIFPGNIFGTFMTFSVGGDATPGSIQAKVDAFRGALGNPNNGNNPGPLNSGRREINWDGGGSPNNSPAGTPFDAFLNTRGAQFTTPGSGFLQAPPGPFDPLLAPDGGFVTAFGDPDLGKIFGAFSPLRIFSPVGSNITDVSFFIPGSSGLVPATVTGFGAIFTDVDLYDSTRIEFFGANNNLIYKQAVAPGIVGDKSLSFLGAVGSEEIFRVRITSGNTPIGSAAEDTARGIDLVAMDDFIYAEPQSVPESGGGIGLMGLVLCFVLFCHRRSLAVC